MGETYAGAGVDIGAGEEAVERIKASVRSTFRPEVIGDVGGFGGLFAFDPTRYVHPVLVAGTDGVGTKLKLAFALDRHDTVGKGVGVEGQVIGGTGLWGHRPSLVMRHPVGPPN